MKNFKIPTAKEFLAKYQKGSDNFVVTRREAESRLIEFSKLHVQEALKEAYLKAELIEKNIDEEGNQICHICNDMGDCYILDKDSILNAYDLNNIK